MAGKGLSWTCIMLLTGNYTVLPAKSDSDFMFCLQSYQGLRIDTSFRTVLILSTG